MNRCEAPLRSKSWYPDDSNRIINEPPRCTHKARKDSPFCGQHKWLDGYIERIVWKENS